MPENLNGPGHARDRSRDCRATAQTTRQGRAREGKGRKGGREGKRKGRSGRETRKGAGLRRVRMASDRREESKRSSGGREGGLRSSQNQKRELNERVGWTAVVAVCFIDRTW
jgi:hypothetical protein